MKATHSGECQLCGRQQKLPNGKLSLHGYTVQWNQFIGDCPGSKGLPYEQSTNLIENAIGTHERAAAALIERAAEVEADLATVWVNEGSYNRNSGRTVYVWRQLPVNEVKFSTFRATWAGVDGKTKEASIEAYNATADIEGPKQLNKQKAKSLRRAAEGHATYVKWLNERLAQFTPRALTPVVEEQSGPIMHAHGAHYSKTMKRSIGYCVGSMRGAQMFSGPTTEDHSQVTCKRCRKQLKLD